MLLSPAVVYNDDYATCDETYVTLRVYPEDILPEVITQRLGVEPSETLTRGEVRTNVIGRTRVIKLNAWFLTSEGAVDSKDVRRHLDWLLDKLTPVKANLEQLQRDDGVRMDVTCCWRSAHGHGGPTLDSTHMLRLGDLGLELGFDIYFMGDDIGEATEHLNKALAEELLQRRHLSVVEDDEDRGPEGE